LAFMALGLIAGVLVGCVGIGGVIIVPVLAYIGGVPFQTAIPAASAAYILSGIIGTLAYAFAGLVPWRAAWPLFIAAMPAALIGAVTSSIAPVTVLEILIGMLAASSGYHALRASPEIGHGTRFEMGAGKLGGIGAVTGFGSALTGTGGPLILVPLLIRLECPVINAIGMAQVIQLPIAILATAANVWAKAIEPVLAISLAAGLAGGTWGGARIAHALPRATLKRVVAVVLTICGAVILVKVAARLLL
jgi:uncharacterized membrane protein YfcA